MMAAVRTEVDLLVLGSGAAGMTAALVAAILGADVLLAEKSDLIGGTSALSAGSVWIPNSRHAAGDDDPGKAFAYLRAALGSRMREEMMAAFLQSGPVMIDFLAEHSRALFRPYPYHPDYLATLDGASLRGRVLEPLPFDGRVLGKAFNDLRPPLPEFTLFGGMMVDRGDISHLMNATRSLPAFHHAARLLFRYAADRLRFSRGARLVMGNALVGRLYHSLLMRRVRIVKPATCRTLLEAHSRIVGAVLEAGAEVVEVRARRGVVLATGGFSRHPRLRSELMPAAVGPQSPVVDTATGDGLEFARPHGGYLGAGHHSNSYWAPVSLRRRSDGSQAVFPHLVLDRGKPGLVAVNPDGRRFVSEATSYHLFVEAMLGQLATRPMAPCFLLCDDKFITRYGLGMVRPMRLNLRGLVTEGYVTKAATVSELSRKLGLPAAVLASTIARHNMFAHSGVDEDFGKGSDAYQRNLGDPAHGPNPCLGALQTAPFYAVRVYPGDIGASCGLVVNQDAQVMRRDGTCVAGLYACGNDMDSIMAGIYPGPGITLGPGMTFGYLAARHALRTGPPAEATGKVVS